MPLNIVFFLTLHAQFIIEIMTIEEAIKQRHSVRKYIHKPLSTEVVRALEEKILECNKEGGLHIQLVTQETKAFSGIMSYGKFHGVENYLVMAGQKDDDRAYWLLWRTACAACPSPRAQHLLGRIKLSQGE